MTVQEASRLWNIPEKTIFNMVRRGKLEHRKDGRRIVILDQSRPSYTPWSKDVEKKTYQKRFIGANCEKMTTGDIAKKLDISSDEVRRIYDEIVEEGLKIEVAQQNSIIQKMTTDIYIDAVQHALWGEEMPSECAKRIGMEVDELINAAGDMDHFSEELADVIIMSLSTAGHLGIDIAKAIHQKMEINRGRPIKHKEAKHAAATT